MQSKRLVRAFINITRRRQLEVELDAEVKACVDLAMDEHIAHGLPDDEARRLALIEVGGIEQSKIRVRESRAGSGIERFFVDLQSAARALHRSPAFAFCTVTMLALGIGVNVTMFSVVDRLLLRALPYEGADRLVQITGSHPQAFTKFSPKGMEVQPPELAASAAFDGFTLHSSGALNLGGDGAERIRAAAVMPEFWATLSSRVHLGRVFSAQDLGESTSVAVIGYRLWQRKFGGDASVLGQTMVLNGQRYVVLGVLGDGVAFPSNAEVWIPAAADRVQHLIATPVALARLAPGVTSAQALDEVVRIQEGTGNVKTGTPIAVVKPLREALSAGARPVALLVAAAAVLVLLIATANAANLLSTHVATREREFVIRSSLGASRARLVRQVLLEASLLSAIGGVAALLAAHWTLLAITQLLPDTIHGMADVAIDARVVAGAVVLCGVTALLFGIAPALSVPGRGVTDILRGVRASAIDPFWRRLRSGLVVAQVAVALVLLSGTWTIVTAVHRFMNTDVGAHAENALTFEFMLPSRTHRAPDTVRSFHARLDDELRHLPGVSAVGVTSRLMDQQPGLAVAVQLETEQQEESAFATHLGASPGLFSAAGIPLIAGRDFAASDDEASSSVAIVTQEYARLLSRRAEEMLGRRVRVQTKRRGATPPSSWAEVVGVIGDVRVGGPESELRPLVYVPLAQSSEHLGTSGIVVVKTTGDLRALAAALIGVAQRVDPDVPLFGIRTFDDRRALLLGERRFARGTMVVFGALAFVLAALGLYAVLAYGVHSRRRELGIRMAVGAAPATVQREVLAAGLRHASLGLLIGSAVAWAASRYGMSTVPGLQEITLVSVALMAAALLVVAALASWIPARRASRVDPALTLRD